jgi:hypothetical protein
MITMEGMIHKSVNAILYGKSTDEKPTVTFQGQEIPNGAKFFEMDTKEVKFYDKDTDSWI